LPLLDADCDGVPDEVRVDEGDAAPLGEDDTLLVALTMEDGEDVPLPD